MTFRDAAHEFGLIWSAIRELRIAVSDLTEICMAKKPPPKATTRQGKSETDILLGVKADLVDAQAALDDLAIAQAEAKGCVNEAMAGVEALLATMPPDPPDPPPSGAKLLFRSGFEEPVTWGINPVNGWRSMTSGKNQYGFAWPPKLWGSMVGQGFQTLGPPDQLISEVTPDGANNGDPRLHTGLRGLTYGGYDSRQLPYIIGWTTLADEKDVYVRMYICFQDNLREQLATPQWADGSLGNWRAVFEWKTGADTNSAEWYGDKRFAIGIKGSTTGNPYWQCWLDNEANDPNVPAGTDWNVSDPANGIIGGRTYKLETFTHRDKANPNNGRIWVAVDGKTICDKVGNNIGIHQKGFNRFMLFQTYTGGLYPVDQWVSEVQIWDGFPSDASAH